MNRTLYDTVKQQFAFQFGKQPLMVFSPGRINLIGEHTDYNEGLVFPAAINKGIYMAIEATENAVCTVRAIDLKETYTFNKQNITALPEGAWQNYILGVIGVLQTSCKLPNNFNMVFAGDIPIGAGLSSSAALENALIYGLNTLFKLGLSKETMIGISQKAEHDYVGVRCGIMDQYASMFGQPNTALLLDCLTLKADPFPITLEGYSILLINSEVSHSLAESAYNARRNTCESIAERLQKPSLRFVTLELLDTLRHEISQSDLNKAAYVITENKRVREAAKALNTGALETLGTLLFASHDGLSNAYEVSCDELDFLVNCAQEHSAVIGARMMGGGFGGCTINLVKTTALEDFKLEVAAAYKKTFKLECTFYDIQISKGTHIIPSL